MNPENEIVSEEYAEVPVAARMPNKLNRRGMDLLEVYPSDYTRLATGQIIKKKVDARVSV